MIAAATRAPWLVRVTAPVAWRTRRRIATKLMGFAATELGSSLDMIRASERTADPRLRRLFYRHGLDEARHAQRFREAAQRVYPGAAELLRPHERLHALRQDLHERLGELDFIAFVHISESHARRQFEALEAHFARRPETAALADLFRDIGRDEQQHSAYSGRLLDERRAAGQARDVDRALRRVRLRGAWAGWRRAGRRIGDLLVRLLLTLLFVGVVPIFAGLARLSRRPRPGWQTPVDRPVTLDVMRRQA